MYKMIEVIEFLSKVLEIPSNVIIIELLLYVLCGMCDVDWVLYFELFNFIYSYLTCSISYGVNLNLDLWNVNRFSSIPNQFNSIQWSIKYCITFPRRPVFLLKLCSLYTILVSDYMITKQ
jgi:hypothetical protein